jgi:hypothetical protein
MWASITAGSILGAGLGHMRGGFRAILPGSLVFMFVAGAGQVIFTNLRHYRQNVAQRTPKAGLSFRAVVEGRSGNNFNEIDPIQMLFVWMKTKLKKVVNIPDWASPLVQFKFKFRLMRWIWIIGRN